MNAIHRPQAEPLSLFKLEGDVHALSDAASALALCCAGVTIMKANGTLPQHVRGLEWLGLHVQEMAEALEARMYPPAGSGSAPR